MHLYGMPMPPSSNSMYQNIRILGRPGRVKTKEMKLWEKAVATWAMGHSHRIHELRALLKQTMTPNSALSVHCDFVFPRTKLISQKNTPKKLDASNRIKATHDALADLIGVDDSYFWRGSFRKLGYTQVGDREWVDITLQILPIE